MSASDCGHSFGDVRARQNIRQILGTTMGRLLAFSLLITSASSTLIELGSQDRFWRHHVEDKSLIIDGVEQFQALQRCLEENLSAEDREQIRTVKPERSVGRKIIDEEGLGPVILVEVIQGMHPLHVKAVQTMATCLRTLVPKMYESRPMYKEFNMKEDPGIGGNCPTHLAPILSIFLPDVVREMYNTAEYAYDASGWKALVIRDELLGVDRREGGFVHPRETGFRASEHLTYKDFPNLGDHHDGEPTLYTVNFAFSGPEDYEGGEFYIVDAQSGGKHYVKPGKYSCIVFLGGIHTHGVRRIKSGHREMFSSELWAYPDIPVGSNLWTSVPENMDRYIEACDKNQTTEGRCLAEFPQVNGEGIPLEEIAMRYKDGVAADGFRYSDSTEQEEDGWWDQQDDEDEDEALHDSDDEFFSDEDEVDASFRQLVVQPQYTSLRRDIEFQSVEDQPHFLVPKHLKPGQLERLFWRKNEQPAGQEGYVVGLPPELLMEFHKYMERGGFMDVAYKILYETERFGNDEHRLYVLNDGRNWGAMGPRWDGTDMIWLDPADEECFESLISVLRRGNFDVVLKSIANAFGLKGLMISGVGPIFLSHFDENPTLSQVHVDLPGTEGGFYNVIVPIHIPDSGFPLYIGDETGTEIINISYNLGVLAGANTYHGTGPCDYRASQGFRLSAAVYMADLDDENLAMVADDSTSLWPTQGDTDWFQSQTGRFFSDNGNSLKTDKGRRPWQVKDNRADCASLVEQCLKDPTGVRLQCAKTCSLYLEDDVYYARHAKRMRDDAAHCDRAAAWRLLAPQQ